MKRLLVLTLGLIMAFTGFSQKAPPNMPHFDDKPFHFGIILGVSSLSTNIVGTTELPLYDSIYGFSSIRNAGVQIGVISDLKMLSFLHLRFIPTLVLTDRTFEYNIVRRGNLTDVKNSLEVIYLEAPLEMKLMSKRYGNFRPYLIGGMKYVYDLGSIKRKKLNPDEYLMKYAEDMLKKEEMVNNLVDRSIDRKLTDVMKTVVTLDTKEVTLKEFNALFEK